MFTLVVLGAGLLAAGLPSADLAAYEAARARAGHDPAEHVKLAVWCEDHGLSAERVKHLALAVLIDPNHAAARGLLGLVAYRGGWHSPDTVAERVRADDDLAATRADYRARRDRTATNSDGHWKLAMWCIDNGLTDEATAHLTAVTRLDPLRDAAWKRLGYKRHEGRWMTADLIAALKADREAQEAADRLWEPRLKHWKTALGKSSERSDAEAQLATVRDPRAVPSVRRVFASAGASYQKRAVAILSPIDSPASSHTLAALGVWGETPEVRGAARAALRTRDPREFVVGLIRLLREPLKFQFMPVGAIAYGSPGFVAVEGPDAISQSVFTLDEGIVPQTPAQLRNQVRSMAQGLPSYVRRASIQNARLASVVASVEQASAVVNELNARSTTLLREVTNHDEGTDAGAWMAWWADQQGYVYEGAPGNAQQPGADDAASSTPYTRRPPSEPLRPKPVFTSWVHLSCFAAGTPVRGIDGPLPIEKVRVGDRVLTQDTGSGLLSYQPVVAVYHNAPSTTLRIDLDGDLVIATGIHRFWSAGLGWVMARDLKVGDRIRTVGGLVTVRSVKDDTAQRVYNLEVARGATFFVGQSGALVHDNSLVQPDDRLFDAPVDLAAPVKPAR